MDSGTPCLNHHCVACCLETRMPLSDLDVKRILALGYSLDCFSVETKNGRRLRNSSGRCVFLRDGCEIYADRPEGCRLYPLIYNEDREDAEIDAFCPHGYEFKVTTNEAKCLRNLYSTIYKRK